MSILAFQVALVVKNLFPNAGDVRVVALIPEAEDPLEEDMATHSTILPGECHGQNSLVGHGQRVTQNWI